MNATLCFVLFQIKPVCLKASWLHSLQLLVTKCQSCHTVSRRGLHIYNNWLFSEHYEHKHIRLIILLSIRSYSATVQHVYEWKDILRAKFFNVYIYIYILYSLFLPHFSILIIASLYFRILVYKSKFFCIILSLHLTVVTFSSNSRVFLAFCLIIVFISHSLVIFHKIISRSSDFVPHNCKFISYNS